MYLVSNGFAFLCRGWRASRRGQEEHTSSVTCNCSSVSMPSSSCSNDGTNKDGGGRDTSQGPKTDRERQTETYKDRDRQRQTERQTETDKDRQSIRADGWEAKASGKARMGERLEAGACHQVFGPLRIAADSVDDVLGLFGTKERLQFHATIGTHSSSSIEYRGWPP